jgi:hypothetical protein
MFGDIVTTTVGSKVFPVRTDFSQATKATSGNSQNLKSARPMKAPGSRTGGSKPAKTAYAVLIKCTIRFLTYCRSSNDETNLHETLVNTEQTYQA